MSTTVEARTERHMQLPPEQVYEAWLQPHIVRLWMPAALRITGVAGDLRHVEIDPRVGGRFLFSDQRGEIEARHWGTYLALEPLSKIVFTWIVDESEEAEPSIVTIRMKPSVEGCLAVITHQMDASWADYIPRLTP